MPKKPKFNSFGKMAEFLKQQEAEATGKKLVDASKNAAKGTRSRISTGIIRTTPARTSKVTILKTTPTQLPEFRPYYIGDENPNVLTQAQQEIRDALVKAHQIDLAKYQRELANRGINTSAAHRKASALAIASNPHAIITSPEGPYTLPYRSAIQEWEGAPLRDWFDLVSDEVLPSGPNALWRKWYQPLHDATHSFDVLGQNYRGEAPSISIQQLGYGLDKMAQHLGIKPLEAKQVVIRKPYVAPSMTVKSKYVAPSTFLFENPAYLAQKAKESAFRDMEKAGIKIDDRLTHPERHIPYDGVLAWGGTPVAFDKYPRDYPTSGHFSTQGFTTRGHMFAEDLESGLSDLSIWHAPTGATFKDSRDGKISEPESVVYIIGKNPNKTGMWKQGGILSGKSGIHIKKENRGKFTSYCGGKVTSECIARGKHSSNPAIRKRATFAANSRKWARKHDNGGKFLNWWKREN